METNPFPTSFDAKLVEDKWYQFWESQNCFKANPTSPKPAYCIVMPPPNVTGVLHMGHALVNTLQDVLVRWKRMQGFEVLWVPGTDHAGIATQTVVERHLIATTGKKRVDFSREEFLNYVWEWKEKSQNSILHQIKKLGASCDWSRLSFSLDPIRSRAVRHVFKKMFDQGLIYRGDYLVNWDPITQTALADDEVEYEERDSFLWHFLYPLEDGTSSICVATTRPETMLGDTAVAVSPNDPRYRDFIGKTIRLPLTDRLIPIIADRHVDPSFGSGAVKVTPAHDPNDYEMGLSHNLPMINIMTTDGKINSSGGEFEGLTMESARKAVVERMQSLGLLAKTEPHKHRVGLSYRSKAVIEPFLSKQWFVKMSHFKQQLREIVESKKVKLVPSNWENTYFHWIDNLRDWCISRQLWWGHRIPIWYHKEDPSRILCHAEDDLPHQVAQDPANWVQEEDVLDTWFSSALWPFSTLGWPDQTPDLQKFYPNTTLVTGHDILFFWVARMILMGSYTLDLPPFQESFLHGLIYGKSYWKKRKDGSIEYITGEERLAYDLGKPVPANIEYKWEKMSKSKGNIIDPLEIIESFGTDAIRMALCASATQARQIDLDRRRFEEYKNFANKLWNGARFVFLNLADLSEETFALGINFSLCTLEDRWILSLLATTVEKTGLFLSEYNFDKAALTAYDFFWKEFCAYYLEINKPFLSGKVSTSAVRTNKQKLLSIILCTCLRLLHPMIPFITEELFSLMRAKFPLPASESADPYTKECLLALSSKACMLAAYPTVLRPEDKNTQIEETFRWFDEILRAIRNIRAEMQIPPSTATDVWIVAEDHTEQLSLLAENTPIFESLVKIRHLHFSTEHPKISFSADKRIGSLIVYIPLPEELQERERDRMLKEQSKLQTQLASLEEKLSLGDFLQKAPAHVLQKLQTQRDDIAKQLQDIAAKMASTFS